MPLSIPMNIYLNIYLIILIFSISLFFSWSSLRTQKKVPRGYKIALFSILLLFGIYALLFVPNLNRVFDDEAIILQRSVGYKGGLYLPDTGPQKHMTVQGIYGILFAVAGPDNMSAIRLNIVLSLIALWLLFHLIYRETDDLLIALFIVVLMILLPAYAIQATSSYVMIISFLFLIISCLAFRAYIRKPDFWTAAMLGSSVSLLILSRVEFLFILPLLLFWEIFHNLRKPVKRTYFLWIVLPVVVFLLNVIDILQYKAWEYSFDPVRTYSPGNLFLHISQKHSLDSLGVSLLAVSVIVIISIISFLIQKNRIERYLLPSISFALIGIYSMNSLIQDYYAIPIIAFLGASSGGLVSRSLKGLRNPLNYAGIFSLLIIALVLSANSIDVVIDESERQPQAFLNTYSPGILESVVPEGCIVVATRSTYVSMGTRVRSIDTNLVNSHPDLLDGEDCIFFYADYFCETDTVIEGTFRECNEYLYSNRMRKVLSIIDSKRSLENSLYIVNESYSWEDGILKRYI